MKYKSEKEAIQHYKDMWKDAPYEPVFVTVDVVIRWRDSILLIKRGNYPGKGKWAIPGGFLDKGETIKEASMRELKEETSITFNDNIWIERKDPIVIDTPDRDPRGRFITHVFPFQIWDDDWEPKAIAGDDAAHVEWVNIANIKNMSKDEFYADHHDILMMLIK